MPNTTKTLYSQKTMGIHFNFVMYILFVILLGADLSFSQTGSVCENIGSDKGVKILGFQKLTKGSLDALGFPGQGIESVAPIYEGSRLKYLNIKMAGDGKLPSECVSILQAVDIADVRKLKDERYVDVGVRNCNSAKNSGTVSNVLDKSGAAFSNIDVPVKIGSKSGWFTRGSQNSNAIKDFLSQTSGNTSIQPGSAQFRWLVTTTGCMIESKNSNLNVIDPLNLQKELDCLNKTGVLDSGNTSSINIHNVKASKININTSYFNSDAPLCVVKSKNAKDVIENTFLYNTDWAPEKILKSCLQFYTTDPNKSSSNIGSEIKIDVDRLKIDRKNKEDPLVKFLNSTCDDYLSDSQFNSIIANKGTAQDLEAIRSKYGLGDCNGTPGCGIQVLSDNQVVDLGYNLRAILEADVANAPCSILDGVNSEVKKVASNCKNSAGQEPENICTEGNDECDLTEGESKSISDYITASGVFTNVGSDNKIEYFKKQLSEEAHRYLTGPVTNLMGIIKSGNEEKKEQLKNHMARFKSCVEGVTKNQAVMMAQSNDPITQAYGGHLLAMRNSYDEINKNFGSLTGITSTGEESSRMTNANNAAATKITDIYRNNATYYEAIKGKNPSSAIAAVLPEECKNKAEIFSRAPSEACMLLQLKGKRSSIRDNIVAAYGEFPSRKDPQNKRMMAEVDAKFPRDNKSSDMKLLNHLVDEVSQLYNEDFESDEEAKGDNPRLAYLAMRASSIINTKLGKNFLDSHCKGVEDAMALSPDFEGDDEEDGPPRFAGGPPQDPMGMMNPMMQMMQMMMGMMGGGMGMGGVNTQFAQAAFQNMNQMFAVGMNSATEMTRIMMDGQQQQFITFAGAFNEMHMNSGILQNQSFGLGAQFMQDMLIPPGYNPNANPFAGMGDG